MTPKVTPEDVYGYMNKLGKTEKGVKFLYLVLLGLDLAILKWMQEAIGPIIEKREQS